MKTKTERVDQAIQDVLDGGRDPALTEHEQKLYDELAAEIRAGNIEADGELWRLDYTKPPPSMEQFLMDDYFLGRTWKPVVGENDGIWPAWKEILTRDLDIDSRIHNAVFTGSLGVGKCLGCDELCRMFDGTLKPVQAIKPNDLLMGDDSTPRRVLSTARGRGPLYQIRPVDGEPFVCNGPHILCLKSSTSDEVEHVSVDDFLRWPGERRYRARLYRANGKTRFIVNPEGEGDYYGFTLDGNHRFLLKDGIVTHNTSIMVTVLMYRLCIACHLKNPQNFFGLNRNSNIVYNVLSITKEAVKDTGFGVMMAYMADSPYFLEHCKYDADREYSDYRIPMLNTVAGGRKSGIWVSAGSKGQHVLGRNLVGIGLDEGNFRLEKDPDLKAYALYDQVRTRIANRFRKIQGFLPAISIIASSAEDESSFTERVCNEINEHNAQRVKDNASKPGQSQEAVSQIVYRNAVYKIKRHILTGIGPDHEWFKVAYGLKNMDPFILSGWYTERGDPIGETPHEEPPSGALTELVPRFYHEEYRRNCKAQLQNLSGISVGGAHRLFSSLIDIETCLTLSEQERVPNPLVSGVQLIPISSEDHKNIWDYLEHRSFLTRVSSRIQPLRHPQSKRYAHIDLATQTLAGVAICHLAGRQLVEGLVRDGEPFNEYRLIVEYDFILTICAGATKPINLEKIQRFFFWLKDMCGFQFGLVTADMWQSAAPLQALEARGFEVDTLSIDRDKKVYSAWRTGFEEHRIRLHRNEQMMREAEQLLEMDKKFDHPDGGSKDTCLATSTKIRLLTGQAVELGELEVGSQFMAYGLNEKREIVGTTATALGITRRNAKIVKVWLDNSKSVTCTEDHLFMLRAGGFKQAGALLPGDSLMPFDWGAAHRAVAKVEAAGIADVTCLSTDTGNFALEAGVFVHNCDGAAGAYFNAINSDEKLSLGTHNAPVISGPAPPSLEQEEGNLVDIPLPEKGYTRRKVFDV